MPATGYARATGINLPGGPELPYTPHTGAKNHRFFKFSQYYSDAFYISSYDNGVIFKPHNPDHLLRRVQINISFYLNMYEGADYRSNKDDIRYCIWSLGPRSASNEEAPPTSLPPYGAPSGWKLTLLLQKTLLPPITQGIQTGSQKKTVSISRFTPFFFEDMVTLSKFDWVLVGLNVEGNTERKRLASMWEWPNSDSLLTILDVSHGI